MATHPGAWVGWDGGSKGMPQTLPDSGVRLMPIGLSAAQVRDYYRGFANATLWPLLHDAIEKPRFERAWWRAYQEVNRVFADRAVAALDERPDAIAWVHDYHLMLVPQLLRDRHADQPIGFFLHVPWPSPDIYARLPWREQVLRGPARRRRGRLPHRRVPRQLPALLRAPAVGLGHRGTRVVGGAARRPRGGHGHRAHLHRRRASSPPRRRTPR